MSHLRLEVNLPVLRNVRVDSFLCSYSDLGAKELLFLLFQILKNITWYAERVLTEISLGSLLILVVIRTIQYNMTRTRVRVTWSAEVHSVGFKLQQSDFSFKQGVGFFFVLSQPVGI